MIEYSKKGNCQINGYLLQKREIITTNIRVNGINVYIKYYWEKYLRILSIKILNNKVEIVKKFI